MRLPAKLCLTLCTVVASALILDPRSASAQLDDPGLSPAPPPAPVKPAPPAPAPAPAPAASSRSTTPAAAAAPAQPGVGDNQVKEEVTEETKVVRPKNEDDVWEAQLAAPSLSAAVGLFRVLTAETGAPGSFRMALHLQGFNADSFLIAGTPPTGDSNSRFLGDFAFSIAGPDVTFVRHFEFYLGLFNSSNQNVRTEPPPGFRRDPVVILGLTDVGFGLKAAGHIGKGFSLGGNIGVRFLNSLSSVAANLDATNVDLNVLATFDVRKLAPRVPLRFHLNIGYIVDHSLSLLPSDPCPRTMVPLQNDDCIRSRVVETFAYGINSPRFRISLAIEAPVRIHFGDGRIFGIDPFLEYHINVATGDGDTVVRDNLNAQMLTDLSKSPFTSPITADRVSNHASQWLSLGLRLRPIVRLLIDLGIDFRVQNPGWQYGPPLPTWNLIGSIGYAYDFGSSETRQVTRTVARTIEINKRVPEGRISGTVTDVETGKPIAGALVRYAGSYTAQSTDDKGQFTSYGLPPGKIRMQVSHPDYESVEGNPAVKPDETRSIPVRLKPLPPKEGKVRVKVVDDKNAPLPGATGRLICGATTKDASFDGEVLVATVPPGVCTLSVEANQFLSKDRQITVTANGDQLVEVQLSKRPKTSHVEITRDAIVIKGSIHFALNLATILPDGQQILDEVVDVLSKNPQIRRVSIEGHTDNAGVSEKNLQLSKDRARAVLDYMVRNGVAAERLTSQGFGQEKPIAPNTSAGNRAKNRRVEFRIIDQGALPTMR